MGTQTLPWETLRDVWVAEALVALEAEGPVREGLRPVLEQFFRALTAAVDQNRWELAEAAVLDWVQRIPERFEENAEQPFSIFQVVLRLQEATDRALRRWHGEQRVQAQEALFPLWAHLLAFAAQKEMEERLHRLNARWEEIRQEVERLSQAKATFISVAAHELRTPLTVIEGYAAMMQEPLERLNHEELRQYLKGIRRGVARMREIVNDLVDLSLLNADLFEISFQPLWLNRIFQGLALELESVLRERKQTLEVRDFPGSDLRLYGDPERLRQAFYNLLTNAIKFTPDGGRITVDGRLLPGFVEVTVSDTGIGIAPEHQEYIFDFFARVGNPLTHSSSKTKFKGGGPGLGLPITKGIIEAHGGTIWVESPGYDEERCPGSTFHVLLPLYDTPPEPGFVGQKAYRRLAQTFHLPQEEEVP